MGGSALGQQAQPLTTAEFKHFEAYCTDRLQALFANIITEYCPKDKEVHGDLDLLCVWERLLPEHRMEGSDRGAFDTCGTITETLETSLPRRATMPSDSPPRQPDNHEMREITLACIRAVGGTRWVRTGSQLCVAVPCELVLASKSKEGASDIDLDTYPFFQLDINLVPKEALDLALLQMSYRSNLVILPRAVSLISPCITLVPTKLSLRYSPYFGQPPITIILTHSGQEVCDWLGLNWNEFTAGPFESEQQLYKWLTNVKHGGRLEEVAEGSTRRRRT